MTIRAITFDLWNTLLRNANGKDRVRLRMDLVCSLTGVPHEKALAAYETVKREFDRCHREEGYAFGADVAIDIMEREMGVRFRPEDRPVIEERFATAILEYPPIPVEGALEAILAAAERFPIGLISDTGISPGRVLRKLMNFHGLLEPFRILIFSDEIGVTKPHRAAFEAAAEGLGVRSDELFHIGDLEYSDIAGAKALGAKAALFTGANDRYLNETRADLVFACWKEFLEKLPELGSNGR